MMVHHPQQNPSFTTDSLVVAGREMCCTLRKLRRDLKRMSQIEATTHYELFHAVLRRENDPADQERSKGVLSSIVLQLPAIRRFLDPAEARLMGLIWEHWVKHKQGVSRQELGEIVLRQDKCDGMKATLTSYDDWAPLFKGSYDAISVMSLIDRCLADYRQHMFLSFVHEAGTIATSGVVSTDAKKGEPDKIGIMDARAFLMAKLQDSLFSNGRMNAGGWVKDIADDLGTVYDRDKARAESHGLKIPTGISIFDKHLGGLERRTLNLILGAAGARKSGLARTIAYNAATQRHRVLFIPAEFKYEEELQIFAAMHACNAAYFHGTEYGLFSVEKIHNGTLDPVSEASMRSVLIPDMKRNLGDYLAIIQPAEFSWPSIRSIIEMENQKAPLDLIVLDYIGCLDIGDARDVRLAYNKLAKEIKDFLLYDLHSIRGGAAMLSPCHSSRKGIEDAKAADGNYVKEAISTYDQFEKSSDVVMFAYMDQGLQQSDMMKIGTCKSRRTADIPAQMVPINVNSHRVGEYGGEKEKKQEGDQNVEVRQQRSNEPVMDGWVPEDDCGSIMNLDHEPRFTLPRSPVLAHREICALVVN